MKDATYERGELTPESLVGCVDFDEPPKAPAKGDVTGRTPNLRLVS